MEHARELVTKILDFILSNEGRLARFLDLGGYQPEALRETVQSPLFMLSALDTVAKDQPLSSALKEQEKVTPAMVEMARARLAFQISVEVAQQGRDEQEANAIREEVEQQMRVLLRKERGDQPDKAPRKPKRKLVLCH